MTDIWAGLTAGVIAGAAGATALNAVTYLDQTIQGDAATSSPASGAPAAAASELTGVDATRAAGLGPLGGLAIGLGVGAVAGLTRGANATPPPLVAAVVTGVAAMLVGDGVAVATGTAESDWASPAKLLRNLVPHLAYGVVTGAALHRMLDPRTSIIHR